MSTTAAAGIQEIKVAHSPDSDDAFMFYGLATNKVRVPGYKFTHVLTDIETLNQRAIHDPYYDVTAISFHAYPYLQDDYALMACGGSGGRRLWPHDRCAAPLHAGRDQEAEDRSPRPAHHSLPDPAPLPSGDRV